MYYILENMENKYEKIKTRLDEATELLKIYVKRSTVQ